MDLNIITTSDFKSYFRRDFPYLPTYDNAKLYNTGALVYYEATELFYTALNDGLVGVLPTDAANWEQTAQDADNYVWNEDIEKAFVQAQAIFNQSLFGDDEQITMAYMYLTAHYLVVDMQAATQGLESSGRFIVSSKSAGSVSESYSVPSQFADNPQFSFWATTGYGSKYISLIAPLLVGNVFVVQGATTP